MMYHNSKFGFTLSEVLITLGVIGVVAALTLPSLIAKHQEKVMINKLKTSYSLLNQAFKQAVEDYGEIDTWGITAEERAANASEILSKYIKVIKKCDLGEKACLADKYVGRKGSGTQNNTVDISNSGSSIVLANGMSVLFNGTEDRMLCAQNVNQYNNAVLNSQEDIFNTCFRVYVDTNGKQKPNFASKDLFYFFAMKDGIVPAGTAGLTRFGLLWSFERSCLNAEYTASSQASCTAWVLANENMDYLHCPDKIGWNKASSCKDAK